MCLSSLKSAISGSTSLYRTYDLDIYIYHFYYRSVIVVIEQSEFVFISRLRADLKLSEISRQVFHVYVNCRLCETLNAFTATDLSVV